MASSRRLRWKEAQRSRCATRFAARKPRVWAEARLRALGSYSNYDLAPDGKRLTAFVADDASREKLPTRLTFLLTFFDELRRRALAGK